VLASLAAVLFALTNFPLGEGHFEPDRPFYVPLLVIVGVLSTVGVVALVRALGARGVPAGYVGLTLWLLGLADDAAVVALRLADDRVSDASEWFVDSMVRVGSLLDPIAFVVLSLAAWRGGIASRGFAAFGVLVGGVAMMSLLPIAQAAPVVVSYFVWVATLFVFRPVWLAWLGWSLRRAPR